MKHTFVKKMTQNFSAEHNFHNFALSAIPHIQYTTTAKVYTSTQCMHIYMVHAHTRNCAIRLSFSLALLSAFVFCSFIFSSLSFSDFKRLALADYKALYKCYRLHFCPNSQTFLCSPLFLEASFEIGLAALLHLQHTPCYPLVNPGV